jgi:hypothetical protein
MRSDIGQIKNKDIIYLLCDSSSIAEGWKNYFKGVMNIMKLTNLEDLQHTLPNG